MIAKPQEASLSTEYFQTRSCEVLVSWGSCKEHMTVYVRFHTYSVEMQSKFKPQLQSPTCPAWLPHHLGAAIKNMHGIRPHAGLKQRTCMADQQTHVPRAKIEITGCFLVYQHRMQLQDENILHALVHVGVHVDSRPCSLLTSAGSVVSIAQEQKYKQTCTAPTHTCCTRKSTVRV